MIADRLLIAVFIVAALWPLSDRAKDALRAWFARKPWTVLFVPAILYGLFLLFLSSHGAFGIPLALVVFLYVFTPVIVLWINRAAPGVTYCDLAAVLLLWLPLELNLGAGLVPEPLRGTAHTMAYGAGVTLALSLFLGFRAMTGMKYKLPGSAGDAGRLLAGLAVFVPVLAAFGLLLSFLRPSHLPDVFSVASLARMFAIIFVGVALPEEILFRGLIQNWLTQRLGENTRSLMLAAIVFGAAHLNNGPGPLPNWRYMILATIAGAGYGWVFRRTSSVLCSTAMHATVNTLRHSFF